MATVENIGLEDLLLNNDMNTNSDFIRYESKVVDRIPEAKPVPILKSIKGASIPDFMAMVEKLVKVTMKDFEVEFIPDENKIPIDHVDVKFNHPIITYKVVSRKSIELKPRLREEIDQDFGKNEDRVGQIYGQKFNSIIQFDFFASVYITVEEVMEKFEEMLLIYSGFFKKNGISEILFDTQLTDSSLDQYRQYMSIRSLRYCIKTEKVTAIFNNTVQEINIKGL